MNVRGMFSLQMNMLAELFCNYIMPMALATSLLMHHFIVQPLPVFLKMETVLWCVYG